MTGQEAADVALRSRDDIVFRLRNYDSCNDRDVDEAADMIEKLRRYISELEDTILELRLNS